MDPPTSMGGGDHVPSLSGSTSVGAVANGINNGTGGKEHDNEERGGKKRLRLIHQNQENNVMLMAEYIIFILMTSWMSMKLKDY